MRRDGAARPRGKGTGPYPPPPRRDRDLQLVRRLDWRFLLPEPELRRVVYLGQRDDALLDALSRFSRSLTVLSPAERRRPGNLAEGTFDVAVVHSPRPVDLERAGSLLRPGGWLYCELKRDPPFPYFRRAGGGRNPRAHARPEPVRDPNALLRKLSFGEIVVHWHHPGFNGCRWIIPLDALAAAAFFRARCAPSVPRPLVDLLAAWAVGSGVLQRLVPCASLIGRKNRP